MPGAISDILAAMIPDLSNSLESSITVAVTAALMDEERKLLPHRPVCQGSCLKSQPYVTDASSNLLGDSRRLSCGDEARSVSRMW